MECTRLKAFLLNKKETIHEGIFESRVGLVENINLKLSFSLFGNLSMHSYLLTVLKDFNARYSLRS